MASPEKPSDKKYVRDKIRKIFEAAEQQYGQQKLIEKCKKLHKKCGNESLFFREFTSALRYVLIYQEKTAVDNILTFISKYISLSFSSSNDQNLSDSTADECAPLVTAVLNLLFQSHGASSNDARLRCMQLLSKILSSMPENSLISDEVWQKLKETVLCRLQDKNLAVRAQTVLTARMLQDPKNGNCDVIQALIFHFNDPSAAVRRAVVSSIALNKTTISHVLARTRDVNDNVRRNAFLVFSKIRATNLTIKFRVTILERGLQDRSEMVRKSVQQIVIINWLENFNNDILKFLESLDVVNCSEIGIKTIEAILKTQSRESIIKQLPIDAETHLIPREKMTPEAVLLWRSLAQYFSKEGSDDDMDAILPNLTTICDHIRGFYKLEENVNAELNEEEQWAEVKERETLTHLLQMLKVFDLSDEMGRLKLKKLVIDMLISPRISNTLVKFLVELLLPVIPSQDCFIQELTEVISEIREPLRTVVTEMSVKDKMERDLKIADLKVTLNELREREYEAVSNKNYSEAEKLKNEIEETEAELKTFMDQPTTLTQEVSEEKNDPVTLCKCLSVLVEMIRCSKVKALTPRLLNLKDNFLKHCMASRDLLTQSLAIEAYAQFCILDKKLAKENLIRFLLMISEDGDNEINIPSLKGVFDIIHVHGIECFEHLSQNKENNDGSSEKTDESSSHSDELNESLTEVKCLKNLNALLNCKTNGALKAVAYEGLCKLLLSGVIFSPSILSRIIIKGFSPIRESEHEDFIRQTFMVFFPIFASKTPKSQEMIEAAFIPLLKIILNASVGTPDSDVNIRDVIAFLIDHTKPEINQHTSETLHVHNNLALTICHELYKELSEPSDSGYLMQSYARALSHLDISLESESFVQQLNTLIKKIEKSVIDGSCVRSLLLFKKKIKEKIQELRPIRSVENTLMTTRESRPSKRTTNQDMDSSCDTTRKKKKGRKTSRLKSVEESFESLRLRNSESGDSGSPVPSKTSRVVVPESPEIFD